MLTEALSSTTDASLANIQTEALSSTTAAYNNRDNNSNTTKFFYQTIIQQKMTVLIQLL